MPKNPELTEIARWHLIRWSGPRSRFDPGNFSTSKRQTCDAPPVHVCVDAPRSLPPSSMPAHGEDSFGED
jgi:hypothetical protein